MFVYDNVIGKRISFDNDTYENVIDPDIAEDGIGDNDGVGDMIDAYSDNNGIKGKISNQSLIHSQT